MMVAFQAKVQAAILHQHEIGLLKKAEYIPPVSYSRGKHWKGKSEEERKQNSEAGQFLYSLSAADVIELEIITVKNGSLTNKGLTFHFYFKFSKQIGYENGNPAYILRAEMTNIDQEDIEKSNPKIHSYPR